MRKHKIADICSKIRDYISEAGVGVAIILLVLLFFISMIVLCIIVDADKNHEMSISSGIIIDKYDCPGHGRYSDAYYFKYKGENSDGEEIIRTDRVTSVTYENYDIGDYYDSENHSETNKSGGN